MSSVKELDINNVTYDIKAKTVVDTNSGDLAFWSGTKQEYDAIVSKDANTIYNITDDGNVGSFANTDLSNLSPTGESVLAGKVDLATGVTQADVDYVVASQLPTSENDYTWYRLYKSGWVEQGGVDNTKSNKTISLPIEMANVNYTVLCTYNASDNDLTNGALNIGAKTTTSFTIKKWSTDETSWEVKGMSAQGGIS